MARRLVDTYETRRNLAVELSDLVFIRATGVAWCTTDSGGCNGETIKSKELRRLARVR